MPTHSRSHSISIDRKHDTENTEEQIQEPTEVVAGKEKSGPLYGLEDVPPWYICILLGIQHFLTMLGGSISLPYLVSSKICLHENDEHRGYIIATTFFVSGMTTFLQSTFGSRLPIVQGPSLSYMIPIASIMNLDKWHCPDGFDDLSVNATFSPEERTEIWQSRMREIQGAVIVGSLAETVIGFTGLIGILMRWITPLVIGPIITLIGLALFEEAAKKSSGNWGIAALTLFLLALFSQYLGNVKIPIRYYKRKERKWATTRYPVFKVVPVFLTILIVWSLCGILTATGALSPGDKARTDAKSITILEKSYWFRFPYPGQWGLPTFAIGAAIGIFAAVFASMIESVGDYYACAKLAEAPPPPTHSINRGIFAEGFGCMLGGLFGTGIGLTSYTPNIAAIGITKAGSRRIVQFASAIIIFIGLFAKLGAFFATFPEPILGGLFCFLFGMITAVGLSTLQYVDLGSTRNLFIIGSSLFLGLCIPNWVSNNQSKIDTGNDTVNNIIVILFESSMFVGGLIGMFLDNTMPGTPEERGLSKSHGNESDSTTSSSTSLTCYDFPFGMKFVNRWSWMRYVPISPTFDSQMIQRKITNLKIFRRKAI